MASDISSQASDSVAAAPTAVRPASPHRLQLKIALLATVCLLGLLLAPLWLVSEIADQEYDARVPGTAEQTLVGIGVILRATARRLVQFGARGAFRTAISTVLRAIARTITRRASRVLIRSAAGATSRSTFGLPSHQLPVISRVRSSFSLTIGVVGLAASFAGSIAMSDATVGASLTTDFGLTWLQMLLLAALPMAVYAGLIRLAGRVYGATTRFATEPDAILLQAYFTGSGSFLPMLTDMIIYGTPKQRRQTAFAALASQYLIHVVLFAAAKLFAHPGLEFAASMFLLYTFIYCFPIHPMEGRAIWDDSRVRWWLLFLPILFSFMLGFPEALLGVV